ncbi:DUF3977 family protein [Lactococcus lactis]|uniref:DUF3977 family protein n=1 Tax=Lactococcus lactis TaxID=1358 RepID=UPI00288F9C97|nr:DUF3977 family protein [Lactococcus lactis]MDT2866763.1 DUF3977 family protein [Lactococcus lactis]MDT2918203.1 DUF3977 family protein [Lactococcus lactis]
MDKIFVEIGLDFDHNRYGLGRSVEIEHPDGSESRNKRKGEIFIVESRYLRLWLMKWVFIFDSQKPYFSIKRKGRLNFKIVVGKWGYSQ